MTSGNVSTGRQRELRARAESVIPGGASTGSKRSAVLFGEGVDGPAHYLRAAGCRLITVEGDELVDCTMSLGAVALGYADEEVVEAVIAAARSGNVSGLAHPLETDVAERLCALVPYAERVRFLKSGAEGVAAAIRIARAATGRELVIGSGYFGWLDWCSDAEGVPGGTRQAFRPVPFDDVSALEEAAHTAGEGLAAIVVEPIVEREASAEWWSALRRIRESTGALLVVDEIKTGFRVNTAGAAAARGIDADIGIFSKALSNGFPLAAVVGRASVMRAAEHTWISSTLAGETVGLAAAAAVLERHARVDVCARLASIGSDMRRAVESAIESSGVLGIEVGGIAPMWLLRITGARREAAFLTAARAAGVLFKRGAYDFAALAHDGSAIEAIGAAARAGCEALAAMDD
jgi:glutamate-1-semialdehyde 2,1-aminomutase